ncbi:hypothetical protein Y027_5806 [Burkholderia pseudomallei TSV5]|nr:hypothetical protein Y027_5806 [Burkholderia pseudomallei TSV5]
MFISRELNPLIIDSLVRRLLCPDSCQAFFEFR